MKKIEFVEPTLEMVQDENQVEDENYAKLKISPLDRGYGMTIGNSLRRVLLSSLPGSAAVAIKIDGVAHEFCAIEGVREDVTEIILNIKDIIFSINGDKAAAGDFGDQNRLFEVTLKIKNPSKTDELVVTAGDINLKSTEDIKVINPEKVVCTLAAGGKIDMVLLVRNGVGYVSNMENKIFCKDIYTRMNGYLPIDSIFTPVKRCKYEVSKTRYLDNFDCDQLILEVWTDGSMTAKNAIAIAAKFLVQNFEVIASLNKKIAERDYMVQPVKETKNHQLDMPIEELNIKARSYHCLIRSNIQTVGDLIEKSELEMMKIPNLGRKSLKEIELRLRELGLSLKNGTSILDEEDDADESDDSQEN